MSGSKLENCARSISAEGFAPARTDSGIGENLRPSLIASATARSIRASIEVDAGSMLPIVVKSIRSANAESKALLSRTPKRSLIASRMRVKKFLRLPASLVTLSVFWKSLDVKNVAMNSSMF